MLSEETKLLKEILAKAKTPKIFILVGPSGVGKSTLCQLATKKIKNLSYVVSATTRPKRPYEQDGKDYYFMSETDFLAYKAKGEFLETTRIYNSYYGILKSEIHKKLQSKKNLIMDVDIQGLINIKKHYPRNSVGIFILPPSIKELQQRYKMRARAEQEDPAVRLKALAAELSWLKAELYKKNPKVDYILINSKLNESVSKLVAIIKTEQVRITGGET
ncbi:MAG: guanylate kinase [candidate division WOR-3 bacterium]|nr:guanylate kinase [candidate division WOR-3 bacterium]MCX7756844.1 guanylate kinase [candidate division WOR-3 bacterium]MDW7988162.1 guanylate kinase [candidate division WOR-3 bacterium]